VSALNSLLCTCLLRRPAVPLGLILKNGRIPTARGSSGVVAMPIWAGVRSSYAGRAGHSVSRLPEIEPLETILFMNIASRMTKASIAT
jgi:hypothetical protein